MYELNSGSGTTDSGNVDNNEWKEKDRDWESFEAWNIVPEYQ